MNNQERAEEVEYSLQLLRTEFVDEFQERLILSSYYEGTPTYEMKYIDQFYPGQINLEMLNYAREYLNSLEEFYKGMNRKAIKENDRILSGFDSEELSALKRAHTNERLSEFVRNNKDISGKIFMEFKRRGKGDLLQKRDPIYQDPTSRFIKAHFYAPRKMIFGTYMQTLWVNVIVIWFMTFVFYLLLYFRVLKRFLDFLEAILRR
jgi:hypothetical protein